MVKSSQKRVQKTEMGPGHRCCSEQKIKRGLWSPEEDEKLIRFITTHGHKSWSSVPKLAGLQRCGKSCRLRWINYLRPDLKRGSFTAEEEQIIIDVHRILGNRWAQIAKHLPGRTDNEIKNFWNSCIRKKLISHGLNPQTHTLLSSSSSPRRTATSAPCNISVSSNIQLQNPNSINFIPMETSTTPFSSPVPKAQPQPNINVQTVSTILSNYNYNNHHSYEFSDFPYESSMGNTPNIFSSCINPSGVGLSDNFRAQTWQAVVAQVVQNEKGIVEVREGEAKGNPEMNGPFEGSNFDFGLLENVLTAEFMSHGLSLTDDHAWNF